MNSRVDSDISVGSAPDPPRRRVQSQVAHLQLGRARHRATSGQGAHAGQQLLEGERLGQVVVGTAVQAGDPVRDRGAGGQHQDRRPHPLRAQPAADLEPVEVGQPHVEQDDVVLTLARRCQRLRPGADDVDDVAALGEATGHQGGELRLVLDQQHAHTLMLGRQMRRG